MKQVTCEMCGGTDLVKQEGVFVCQSCNSKYLVDEVKKMMVEGIVEIKGKVKIDKSDSINNYFELARRAKNIKDYSSSLKYYNMIVDEDSMNWEAVFYSGYFNFVINGDVRTEFETVNNLFSTTFYLINNVIKEQISKDNAIREIVNYVIGDIGLTYEKNCKVFFSIPLNGRAAAVNDFVAISSVSIKIMYIIGDEIEKIYKEEKFAMNLSKQVWKNGLKWHKDIIKYLDNYKSHESEISRYSDKVKKINNIMAEFEKKETNARFTNYWDEHTTEKSNLQDENENISKQISLLNEEVKNISGMNRKIELESRIKKLKADRNLLGIFKGKEKKELQNQINILEKDLASIAVEISAAVNPINSKITRLKNRQIEIQTELTKPR